MRTGDLIEALAADAKTRRTPPAAVMLPALAAGAVVAGAALLATIGIRADVAAALATTRFPYKFVVVLGLAIPSIVLLLRLARPAAPARGPALALLAFPALAAAGIVAELFAVPSQAWAPRLIGNNAAICMTVIPLLAVAPLTALLLGLRQGAPTRPALTGAVAGLAAGAVAAFLYGWHCYPLAICLPTAVGAAAGSRLLRW
jgi:hypothetical protein